MFLLAFQEGYHKVVTFSKTQRIKIHYKMASDLIWTRQIIKDGFLDFSSGGCPNFEGGIRVPRNMSPLKWRLEFQSFYFGFYNKILKIITG